jgi:hypothetical protein
MIGVSVLREHYQTINVAYAAGIKSNERGSTKFNQNAFLKMGRIAGRSGWLGRWSMLVESEPDPA